MALDLNNPLLKWVLSLMGYDSVQDLAETEARKRAKTFILAKMLLKVKSVQKAMKQAGMTPAKGDTAFIRDALFRLWRSVLAVPAGGHLADLIRDGHDDKIIAQLADQITPEMGVGEALKLIAPATVELLF